MTDPQLRALDPAFDRGADRGADPGPVPGLDPQPYGEVLSMLEWLERQRRAADAARLALIGAALDEVVRVGGSSRELAYRSLRAELAAALSASESQIEQEMSLAHRLKHDYPPVFGALERAEISLAHARVIVDAGIVIGTDPAPDTAERRRGYAREVLEVAQGATPGRLRPTARRIAETWAERPLRERHREARARRRVTITDHDDGMAELTALLPAVEAYAVHDRLTRLAKACEHGRRVIRGRDLGDDAREAPDAATGSPRTRDQLRADVLLDLLLATDDRPLFAGDPTEAIRARVQVVIPIAALTALSTGCTGGIADTSEPVCELTGYGPIDPETAALVAGAAPAWDRVLINDTGDVLRVDRYRPTEHLRRHLSTRDEHCRFPGCTIPASRCDLDHTVDAARGGLTSTDNLAHLCRSHHTLKHHTDWTVEQAYDGTLTWTSPTARTHHDRPERAGPPARTRTVSFTPDEPAAPF